MSNDLVPALLHGIDQFGIAFRHCRVHREAGGHASSGKGVEHAKHPHPIAVIARGVMPVVGIRRDHVPGRAEGFVRWQDRKPFQADTDEHRHRRVAGPADRFAGVDIRPPVEIVIVSLAAPGIIQIAVRQAHRSPPPWETDRLSDPSTRPRSLLLSPASSGDRRRCDAARRRTVRSGAAGRSDRRAAGCT